MKRYPILTFLRLLVVFTLAVMLCAAGTIVYQLVQNIRIVPVFIATVMTIWSAVLLFLYVWQVRPSLRHTRKAYLDFAQGKTLEIVRSEREHDFLPETDIMLRRLDELVDRENKLLFANKQAEYQALQNQINPHFLYNALEAIRGDALTQGMESLAQTAEALSAFFRYSISDTALLASVDSEIVNIRNYFQVQRYRFGDEMGLDIHFLDHEEEIRRLAIPKLTLQPIVENSVFHGLEPQVDKGRITITFDVSRSFLYISVRDTGIGMSERVCAKLNASLNETTFKDETAGDETIVEAGGTRHTGIALKNVSQRIKLLFGNEYGLHVFSTAGIGTNVVITLPRQEADA